MVGAPHAVEAGSLGQLGRLRGIRPTAGSVTATRRSAWPRGPTVVAARAPRRARPARASMSRPTRMARMPTASAPATLPGSVIEEHAPARLDAELRRRCGVDRRVGLAHADPGGVDDDVEQLVDGDDGPPVVADFLGVVGQHRGAVAGAAQLGGPLDHWRHAASSRWKRARRQRDATGLGFVDQPRAVLGQRDLAALDAVPRVVGVLVRTGPSISSSSSSPSWPASAPIVGSARTAT